MTEPSIAAEDMDAILDDALDELDDSDSDSDDNGEIDTDSSKRPQQTDCPPSNSEAGVSKTAPVERKDPRRVPFGPPRPPPTSNNNNNNNTTKKKGENAMEESILKMFRDLAVEADAPPNNNDKAKPTSESKTPNADASTIPGDEKMLQDLFQGLMAAGGDDAVDGGMPDMDEIPDLDNLFAGLGDGDGPKEGFNSDDFVDGMMEQLLSKELMYEPMKQVTEKFPAWLASKQAELAPDEWDQRNRQFECFQRLVQAYEEDDTADGQAPQTAKLLEIMQEVQEYGQPPHEIINEIAPGLELDQDGLPKMNGGMMPPFLGGNPDDCRIM